MAHKRTVTPDEKRRIRTALRVLIVALTVFMCLCYIRIRPALVTSSLIHAIEQGKVADVNSALNQGADPNALVSPADDWYGGSANLLEAVCGTRLHDVQRETPLLLATLEGKDDIAQLLVANGANVRFKDGTGSTALMWAAYYCKPTTVQLLVDKGADVNSRWKDGTPVLSEAYGRPEVVAILKRAGAKE